VRRRTALMPDPCFARSTPALAASCPQITPALTRAGFSGSIARGRPPYARAAASPAATRSLIRARSYSASEPNRLKGRRRSRRWPGRVRMPTEHQEVGYLAKMDPSSLRRGSDVVGTSLPLNLKASTRP
jgi:hypothetical protein